MEFVPVVLIGIKLNKVEWRPSHFVFDQISENAVQSFNLLLQVQTDEGFPNGFGQLKWARKSY